MDFKIDSQTKLDLNLFPQHRDDSSVFAYFDVTRTKGGKASLFKLFNDPSNDIDLLTLRQEAITFLVKKKVTFEFEYLDLDFIEHYLSQHIPALRDNVMDAFVDKITNMLFPQSDYYIITRGIAYLTAHINKLKKFVVDMATDNTPHLLKQMRLEIEEITQREEFQAILNPGNKLFSFRRLNSADRLIRKRQRDDVLKLLEHTYLLDALCSVATIAVKKNLSFPQLSNSAKPVIDIKDLFHPFLKNPVANDVTLGQEGNLCFVSGPNMAGKSTLLKSVGICVYLSQIGFPVPARQMETSLFNGIFSSINLSDNINTGYSHYYTEVKRVKEIVLTIKERSRVCVLFDELFKGTNVKDAYDATLMVMTGFTKMKENLFFASTHIIEVAAELKQHEGITFKYLDSSLIGNTPVYHYKLLDGISTERLGLLIVKQEGIMQIIDEIIRESDSPS